MKAHTHTLDQNKVSARSQIKKFQVVTEFFVKMETIDKKQGLSRASRSIAGQSGFPSKSTTLPPMLNISGKKSTALHSEFNLSSNIDDNMTSSSQYKRPQLDGPLSN